MAWQARIAGKRVVADALLQLRVEFFDDADSATVLHRHLFEFPMPITRPEVRQAVRDYGRRVRDERGQAQTTADSIPADDTFTV